MKLNIERILYLIWISLSIFVIVSSYKYGLGTLNIPGPGLTPFIFGLFLLLASLVLIIRSFLDRFKKPGNYEMLKIFSLRTTLVLTSFFIYVLLLNKFGFLITTCFFLMFLFRTMGIMKWSKLIFSSVLIVLSAYFIFGSLGVRLPAGILKW